MTRSKSPRRGYARWLAIVAVAILLGVVAAFAVDRPAHHATFPASASSVAVVTLDPNSTADVAESVESALAGLPGVEGAAATNATEVKVYFADNATPLDVVKVQTRATAISVVKSVQIEPFTPSG